MTSTHWASGLEVIAAISPAFALLLMEPKDNQEEPSPNLPLVPVRGVTNGQAMQLYERYGLEFSPPGYNELKLCEVILALEETVEDLLRSEAARRKDR